MHNQQQDALGVIQLMLGGIQRYQHYYCSDLVGGGGEMMSALLMFRLLVSNM
jgi:hypothetical protein